MKLFRGVAWGFLFALPVWLLLAWFLSSCAATSSRPALPAPLAGRPSGGPQLDSVTLGGAMRAVGLAPDTRGRINLLHGSTACRATHGVNPYVYFDETRVPTIGHELRVLFTSRAMPPFPNEQMWIIWSLRAPTREIPLDMTPFHLDGCQMVVNPDNVTPVRSGDQGLFTRGNDGSVVFAWTPPSWSSGTQIYAQLLVLAPGETPAGYMLSPGVFIEVGSR